MTLRLCTYHNECHNAVSCYLPPVDSLEADVMSVALSARSLEQCSSLFDYACSCVAS